MVGVRRLNRACDTGTAVVSGCEDALAANRYAGKER
jgi:hypothetical protein